MQDSGGARKPGSPQMPGPSCAMLRWFPAPWLFDPECVQEILGLDTQRDSEPWIVDHGDTFAKRSHIDVTGLDQGTDIQAVLPQAV